MGDPLPVVEVITRVTPLPRRKPESNKGDYGRVLVVAGSQGMSGAAILCASAALRGGAGLVKVAVPADVLPVVAAGNPCYMTVPLPGDEQGRLSPEAARAAVALVEGNDVLAVGPGLGRAPGVSQVVFELLEKTHLPMVLDADGLNAMQGHTSRLKARPAPLILTPHPGEFARLLGSDVATVQSNREKCPRQFAFEHQLIVVLKGQGTVVTDGRRVYVNDTGNPGMATGGTGDVLTGLIAALLGQGIDPFPAAQLGVHVHGLAGDLARDAVGEASLIASDLLTYLPAAFRRVSP
jgi:NAD(P)H-hydrate epimerase